MATDRAQQKEGSLLRRLAGALSADPSMSYQRLADTIGVSRRTLYRLAPSREHLFERLRQEAFAANVAALDHALATQGSALHALATLTENFVADSDLYEFWTNDAPTSRPDSAASTAPNAHWDIYRKAMAQLFERGQAEGVIRTDLPMLWLTQSYDGLLLAAAVIRRNRKDDGLNLPDIIMRSFLNGIGAGGAQV